jgi:hypothetical protein
MSREVTLSSFYDKQYGGTSFTRAFLSGSNLLLIQEMLTAFVRSATGLPSPQVAFSDAILGGLISFATEFAEGNDQELTILTSNEMFVEMYAPGLIWDTNYDNSWKRWCRDGIPDPANIPLPKPADRRDMSLETSAYRLSHPWGTAEYPRW